MRLNEIVSRRNQAEFEDVELLDPEKPNAWQPNTEDETKKYEVRFTYDWYPAERGSRERGSGMQLDPDYSASIEIKKFEVYDPVQKKWLDLDENVYLGETGIEQYTKKILEQH